MSSFSTALRARTLFKFHVAAFCAVLSLSIASVAAAQNPPSVPGQYLMKFRPQSAQTRAATVGVQAQLGVQVVNTHPEIGAHLVQAAPGQQIDHQLAKDLLAQGVLEYFEPNYIVSINDRVPNDPQLGSLWGMNNTGQTGGTSNIDIDAPAAWDLTTGSSTVVVGIVDTGIEYTHPDLAANVWHNPGETPGNGIDDDNNGVIDDYYGYNAIDNNGNPLDLNGHGTHCAGTIGAVGNNGVGVAGVNWNVKLMGLRFLDANGFGSTESAISAIAYAVRMKQRGINIRVLSNSWGGGGDSQALRDAIQNAANADILFVAAAGNSSQDNDIVPNYPSNYDTPNMLAVAAADANGNLAYFSNYGANTVHLAAPGVDILSTYLGGGYNTLSGTSMATPHVAGVAALVAGREPSLSTVGLRERLVTTVKVISTLNGLMSSPGMVNAANSLTNARAPLPPPSSRPSYTFRQVAIAAESSLGSRIFNQDDGYTEIALPFAFPYFGASYTRAAVSANGRIIPLAAGIALPTGPDYANSLSEGIAVYYDDLYPSPFSSDSGVWMQTAADHITLTWVAVHYGERSYTDTSSELRVQAKLFADGRIEFHYLDAETLDQALSRGGSATVGLAPSRGVIGTKVSVQHNDNSSGYVASGSALRFDPTTGAGVKGDFDGDGSRDLFVWRPASGMWFISPSASDYSAANTITYQLGLPGDLPRIGDFDGDRKPDLAVWRPSNGTWYFRYSGMGYQTIVAIQWGLPGDLPVVGDYDGNGKADLTVYRQSAGVFYVLRSSTGFDNQAAFSGDNRAMMLIPMGGFGHDIVVGDFTGDGKDEFVTVWQVLRFWSLKDSNNQLLWSLPWGMPGDTPLACDTNGNRIAGRTVARVISNFTLDWFTAEDTGGVATDNFGSIGDTPLCGDYDGDGKDDITVFRPYSGDWFIRPSKDKGVRYHQFGLAGDIPL